MEHADTEMILGWHGIAMLVLAVLVLLGVVYLVLYFARVVAGDASAAFRAAALDRFRTSRRAALETPHGEQDEEPGEADAYIVIPDICGYTRFLQLRRFSLGHAQYIVSSLLQSILDSMQEVLRVAKIEGDAILLYGLTKGDGGKALTAEQLSESIAAVLRAFYRRRTELERDNACPCGVCHHVEELELKVIVHRGRILRYQLRGTEELSGVPVIAAHRLLKNTVTLRRYVLVTEAAEQDLELPFGMTGTPHVEHTDVGEISGYVYGFEPETVAPAVTMPEHGELAAKVVDTAHKVGENIRMLGRRASQAGGR